MGGIVLLRRRVLFPCLDIGEFQGDVWYLVVTHCNSTLFESHFLFSTVHPAQQLPSKVAASGQNRTGSNAHTIETLDTPIFVIFWNHSLRPSIRPRGQIGRKIAFISGTAPIGRCGLALSASVSWERQRFEFRISIIQRSTHPVNLSPWPKVNPYFWQSWNFSKPRVFKSGKGKVAGVWEAIAWKNTLLSPSYTQKTKSYLSSPLLNDEH